MNDLIKPMKPLIKELENQAMEADWQGDRVLRDRLMSIAADKRKALDNGQEYEVMF